HARRPRLQRDRRRLARRARSAERHTVGGPRPAGRLPPELVAERVLERRVAEREARGLEPRRLDARARQQQLVRHLTEQESRGEGGQGKDRRASQDAPERARELAVLHRLWRDGVYG